MNNLDFYDDDNIRNSIIEKIEKEKSEEEEIRISLEKISEWYDIEQLLILEKEKILKSLKEDTRSQYRTKLGELRMKYGENKIEKIKRKYNLNR